MAVPPVKQPRSISQARKMNKDYFVGKEGKKKAAVTKEELKESGFKSLREFLNNRRKEAKTGADISAPKSKARPAPAPKASAPAPKAKRETPASVKESSNADLSAPEIPKSRRGSSAPLGGKADPFKYVGIGERGKLGQAPVPTTEEKVAMAGLVLSALGGPGTIAGKAAIKGATKFGKPFITNMIKKIKDLTPKQQKEVLQTANKGKTKTEAEKLAKDSMRVFKGGKSLKRDNISEVSKAAKNTRPTPRTAAQKRSDAMLDAAKQSQRREIDPSYTGGTLKKGGQIKKYNKGGKVYKRKEGGQVMSGNDLVSSIYN